MRVLCLAAVLLSFATGAAGGARAAELPRFLPLHDAAITYRTSGSDPLLPASVTIRYAAGTERLRVEGGPIGYVLVDRAQERVELVMPQPRLVIELPPGGGITDGFLLGPGLDFTRAGADRVLGRACTLYDVTADRGRAHGRVCLTSDGLLLRGEGQGRDGRNAGIEAVSVAQVAQPPGLFTLPDGYRSVALPR